MIAILYPLKMDKNLSEAYSTIYESSQSAGSSGGHYSDGGDGVFRSKEDVARKFNKNFPPKKNGKVDVKTRKAINTSAGDFGIQGPTTVKNSYEPEGEVIDEKLSKEQKDKYDAHVNKMKEEDKKTKKTGLGPAFDDPSHHSFAKNKIKKNIFDSYDNRYSDNTGKKSKKKLEKLEKKHDMKLKDHPQFTRDDVGKFRQEWEALKLIETENHREKFDTWLEGIAEEGYDIERWTDEELVDTFINENDLWDSKESVETALLESDKKGKGSGKKDACYHKVKASASVWPSAYASGRLVQCRKKGAANYGKSSKKEDFSDWRSDIQLDELNKQERMETAKRGGGGVGKRFAKKTLGANRAGKGKLFGGYDHRGTGNVGRRNIRRFETDPVEREDGSLDKKRKQTFKKVKVLNPKSGYKNNKVTARNLGKFGSDVQHDYVSKDGLHTQSSDHAQKQRRKEHENRRGVKTKGTDTADMKKALKDDYSYVNDVYLNEFKKQLIRQGIKLGGKGTGKVVKKGIETGEKVAINKGREVAANAATGNKDKMVGDGKYEKMGAAIGGTLGTGAGFLVPDGPAVVAGEIAGGIAGSKLGGKLGRQIDKARNK